MNALFLSASTGGGHAKAAEALIECMKLRNPASEALFSNSLENISPIVDKIIIGTYLHTLRNTPGIYGALYRLSEKDESITGLTRTLNRFLSYGLYHYLCSCTPSVIVCTHTFPLQMVSSLKRRGSISVPVVGIVTDFVNHSFWKLENIDAFVVAHEYIREDMIRMGIPGGRIHTYGIPVCRNFLQRKSRNTLLTEFGLKDRDTVLVMGGSLGFGEIKYIFSSLIKCKRGIQIIVVTGFNKPLEKQLVELSHQSEKPVRIFSYTDRISDLMDISDLIITKPGGVSISEALVKQLPILLMSPLPGQEERNARFLLNSGVAARFFKGDSMDCVLHQILDNPLRLRQMREMSAYLAHPDASEKIVELMEGVSQEFYCESRVREAVSAHI